MSIIAGAVDPFNPGRPVELVTAMLADFRQHCPDGVRTLDRRACALSIGGLVTGGLRRRSAGSHESGKICAIVDGRLDRTAELCVFLGIPTDASDAEVVLASYCELGLDCFSRFRGDFAIVIWDGRSETLVAARDPFAIRPLYYAKSERWLVIASDPEQILASGLVSPDPDEDMVVDYLLWNTRFVDRTFFRGIKALPAGHLMVSGPAGSRVSRFHASALTKVQLSSRDEYWAEYKKRFSAAVETCVESRFPVVAELSGGLDSSAIVCATDAIIGKRSDLCPAFVAAAGLYPGLSCDEGPFIRAVADHVKLRVECWDGTDARVNELDPSSVALPGGRFGTFSGTDGQTRIARAQNARVLISGVGGDQIGTPSGGIHDAIAELRWLNAATMVFGRPGANAKTVAKTIGALGRSFIPRNARRFLAILRPMGARPSWLSTWAKRYPRPRFEPDSPIELQTEIQKRTWRSLNSGPHALVMAYIQHHAIRNGLDVRFPFLDVDLVSIALSVPSRLWPPPWPFERLHREILRDILPPAIVARRSKANFEPAVVLRVRRHLPAIHDLFSSRSWKSGQFVEIGAARRLLETFKSAKGPDIQTTYGIWALATLEAWMWAISRYAPPTGRGTI